MLCKIKKFIKELDANRILALLFLAYIFYVGSAALPSFGEKVQGIFTGNLSVREFIDQTDDQYYSLLSTEKQVPLLQNKGTYINLNGQMASRMKQTFVNNCVKLTNGHLTTFNETGVDSQRLRKAAENVSTLSNAQKSQGKHFLFVLAPGQICKYENLLPTGYTDTSNADSDTLLAYLNELEVPYLDLRESLHEDGLTHDEAYFITDHHWTTQTGFWAYTKILDCLEEMGAIHSVDTYYTDLNNFHVEEFENFFLGGWGKRVGLRYTALDNFDLVRPKFETNITIQIPEKDLTIQESYENNARMAVLSDYQRQDHYNSNPYMAHGFGDNGFTQRINEDAPDNTKIMLIGDSFGNIPFSLMSLYFSDSNELDMRYYSENFAEYYQDYDAEIIILLIYTQGLVTQNTGDVFFPDP